MVFGGRGGIAFPMAQMAHCHCVMQPLVACEHQQLRCNMNNMDNMNILTCARGESPFASLSEFGRK